MDSSWAISNTKRWSCESAALNMPANLENSAVAIGLEKVIFIPIPKKGKAKECSNYGIIALISHASKVMHKILQDRLQQFVKQERPDVQAGFRKGRGTRDQIAIRWIIKKARGFQKTSTSTLLTMPKPLTVWITTNSEKFWKRWEYQTTHSASWEICMQVKKQQLEVGMDQQIDFKLGKKYVKNVYCHLAYFTYMQSTSWETGWMKHKLESRLLGEISVTSDMQMTPNLWQGVKNKRALRKSGRGQWKSWLKTQHSEN